MDQPAELWQCRLKRISQLPYRLCSRADFESDRANAEWAAFEQLVEALHDGISGIGNYDDRSRYALLTLQRLILIQSMQQKGWLNGDAWYLQNRFGKALQIGSAFFADYLQPLYRSLALPEVERSLTLVETTGIVPFWERIFDQHPLEKTYADVAIANQAFEEVLGWLSEQSNSDALNPFSDRALSYCLWRYWNLRSQADCENSNVQQTLYKRICSLSLDAHLKKRILNVGRSRRFDLQKFESASINNLLFNANARICRNLIQEVLPALRILDPACGSGRLLSDLNYRLIEIFSLLTGYIQQTQDAQLRLWQAGLKTETTAPLKDSKSLAAVGAESDFSEAEANLLLGIQKRVLRNNLYGVDIVEGAAETARFQLLLAALALARTPDELNPLPDLSFNVLTGNSLVGFIKVDEKRFDQVNTAGMSSILQGNLLQPLAADGYKTTLAEKNLAIEHYTSRNQMLAAASIIPAYARASLLREEITQLDMKAQSKLNALLLSYMSQQLGIQHKSMQLADKPQRRLLTAADVDILQPFHWGYHFNRITEAEGFDVIACVPPCDAFRPTVEEFVQRFRDLAMTKNIDAKTLKTSKQALSQGDPEVTQAWMFYQDTYTYVSDYFYRSEQYAHQNPTVKGKGVRNQLIKERLFVERCLSLLSDRGVGAIALNQALSEEKKAQTIWTFLQQVAECSESAVESAVSEESDSGKRVVLSVYKSAST